MLFRIASAFALAALPLARAAYTVDTPQVWYGNVSNVVSWNSLTTDPPLFSVELVHPQNIVGDDYAIANNVDANLLSILVPLPRVTPGPGYTLHLVNPGNISDIYASSGQFTIVENDITSASPSGSAPTLTGASTAPPLPSQPSSLPATTTGNNTASAHPTTAAATTGTTSAGVNVPGSGGGNSKPFSSGFAKSVPAGGLALAFAIALAL
jgi:hypothetical protein